MNRVLSIFFISMATAFFILLQSVFMVTQTQKGLILQFGRLVRVIEHPGLYIKKPFIQETILYDKRILALILPPTEVTLQDQKRVVTDIFVRYRIQNVTRFYKTLEREAKALMRLSSISSGVLRSVLGKHSLPDLLSAKRSLIMKKITARMNQSAEPLGIEIIDVRLVRTDLPVNNSAAIFKRMESERTKEALEIKALGKERGEMIRADAHLEGEKLVSDALEKSGHIRADGKARSLAIYLDAYGKSPDFARLYQTLEGYRQALSTQTLFILTPENSFLEHFHFPSQK